MTEGYFLRKNSGYGTKSVGITAIQAKQMVGDIQPKEALFTGKVKG
jgi:hypothetical protein